MLDDARIPDELIEFFKQLELVQLRLPPDAMKQDVLGQIMDLDDDLAGALFVHVCARTHDKAITTAAAQAAKPQDLTFHLLGEGVLIGLLLAKALSQLREEAEREHDAPADAGEATEEP